MKRAGQIPLAAFAAGVILGEKRPEILRLLATGALADTSPGAVAEYIEMSLERSEEAAA